MNKQALREAVGQPVKAHNPTKAGYRAGRAGRREDSNPHRFGTDLYKQWNDGWLEGFTVGEASR
ncbi:ribosome modulation factor [Pseudomonas sp. Marseille-Q7302]